MRIENIEKRYKIVFVFFSPVLCTVVMADFALAPTGYNKIGPI